MFGVKGWVKVFSYTRPREAILDYSRWYLKRKDGWQLATVCEGQRHGKSVIAHFDGVDDRDQAAELIECEIAIARDDLAATEEGSYYWADLEGMRVVHRDGTELGHVAYMMETGANDVMVTAGERERLIPFIADKVILDVDFDKGEISVDWEWD
ncbi:MAG: ribosome maturation factor RimM [Gammaproteobacteria bacterium]|nr:ribosome maturation factor RimM [Gammaproteobacteria bacterium]